MSAKKTGHRRQQPAPPVQRERVELTDLAVCAPRFTSASDKLARAQREQIRRRANNGLRPSCKSKGAGYYAEKLHTFSTRVDARGNIYTVVCN